MKDLHDVVAFELFGMKFDHCLDKEEVIHEVEKITNFKKLKR